MIPSYLTSPVLRCIFHPMKTSKAMTIRLTEEQAEALETVASVEQRAVSDVIRAAISEHIESRRKDPAFQEDPAHPRSETAGTAGRHRIVHRRFCSSFLSGPLSPR